MQKKGWNQSKFLIDGFPRNEDNCEGFDRILGKDVHMPFMIFLDCSKETMISRIQKRARETDGQRNDDNTEVLIKRFDTFQQQTLPVLKKYQLTETESKLAQDYKREIFSKPKQIFNLGCLPKVICKKYTSSCISNL